MGAAGINLDEFIEDERRLQIPGRRTVPRPDDVIIDDYYAEQNQSAVGDTITLLNSKWHVAGIIEGGKLAHIVVPIETLQERNGNRETSARSTSSSTIRRIRKPSSIT